jgi:hypothetical protein
MTPPTPLIFNSNKKIVIHLCLEGVVVDTTKGPCIGEAEECHKKVDILICQILMESLMFVTNGKTYLGGKVTYQILYIELR